MRSEKTAGRLAEMGIAHVTLQVEFERCDFKGRGTCMFEPAQGPSASRENRLGTTPCALARAGVELPPRGKEEGGKA